MVFEYFSLLSSLFVVCISCKTLHLLHGIRKSTLTKVMYLGAIVLVPDSILFTVMAFLTKDPSMARLENWNRKGYEFIIFTVANAFTCLISSLSMGVGLLSLDYLQMDEQIKKWRVYPILATVYFVTFFIGVCLNVTFPIDFYTYKLSNPTLPTYAIVPLGICVTCTQAIILRMLYHALWCRKGKRNTPMGKLMGSLPVISTLTASSLLGIATIDGTTGNIIPFPLNILCINGNILCCSISLYSIIILVFKGGSIPKNNNKDLATMTKEGSLTKTQNLQEQELQNFQNVSSIG